MGQRIDTVVFDLGGVVLEWDPAMAFRDVLPADQVQPFLEEVRFHDLNRGIDAGRPIAEVVAEVDERFPHHAGVLAAYPREFAATLTGEVPGTADLVRELDAAGVRLLALTNWSAETFPVALERFDVLALFEAVVVSGAERVAKPDPRLFQILLERHRVRPERAAYVDDSAANVAAAAELGLSAFQFTDADRLRADLAGLGLPVTTHP